MIENPSDQDLIRKRQKIEDLKGRCITISLIGGLLFIPMFIFLIIFFPIGIFLVIVEVILMAKYHESKKQAKKLANEIGEILPWWL